MKFKDVLNYIKEKDLENFLEKIKEKEKKIKENLLIYIWIWLNIY